MNEIDQILKYYISYCYQPLCLDTQELLISKPSNYQNYLNLEAENIEISSILKETHKCQLTKYLMQTKVNSGNIVTVNDDLNVISNNWWKFLNVKIFRFAALFGIKIQNKRSRVSS
ncbi:Hypothetical_protein [Hexamita inflata]|uniref:Hypothetical_protein n=1 Tax=Hexamita inflata TaxID=28002 RepID=A0AA86U546_9EUKA|nr:Hypothetical protein HINF_LOCUS30720 [Hexamita inflata]